MNGRGSSFPLRPAIYMGQPAPERQCASSLKDFPTLRCERMGRVAHEGRWYCRRHAPALPRVEEDVYADSGKLCDCGCGEEVNRYLAIFQTYSRDGATNSEIAQMFDVDRSYVGNLLRNPPRFLVGHAGRAYWASAEGKARREAWRKRVGRRRAESADYKERRRVHLQEHALVGFRTRSRVATVKEIVSLDEPLRSKDEGFGGERHDFTAALAPSPFEELVSSRLREIVGDMTPDDVLRMTESDLSRLRARLLAEGIAPGCIQQAERDRLTEPARHTGATVSAATPISRKKKRRQRIAHKAANAARGNSNRPARKPRKRWERETSHEA